MTQKRLVLFDIDGTLIRRTGAATDLWQKRICETLREVYGISLTKPPDSARFNGLMLAKVLWILGSSHGVSRSLFNLKYEEACDAYARLFVEELSHGVYFTPIEEAIGLVKHLRQYDHIHTGIITSNIEKNAWGKLQNAGIKNLFTFGLFGNSAIERSDLASQVYERASVHFRYRFTPDQIVIIGDTKHDIQSAKAIGVKSIAVLTGTTETRETLAAEKPDLLVDTLADPSVLKFLQVPNL